MKFTIAVIACLIAQTFAVSLSESNTSYSNGYGDKQTQTKNLDVNVDALRSSQDYRSYRPYRPHRHYSSSCSNSNSDSYQQAKKPAQPIIAPGPVVLPKPIQAQPIVAAAPVIIAKPADNYQLDQSITVFKAKQQEIELAQEQTKKWNQVIADNKAYLNNNVDNVVSQLSANAAASASATANASNNNTSTTNNNTSTTNNNNANTTAAANANANASTNTATVAAVPIVVAKPVAIDTTKDNQNYQNNQNYKNNQDNNAPYYIRRHGDHSHVVIGDAN